MSPKQILEFININKDKLLVKDINFNQLINKYSNDINEDVLYTIPDAKSISSLTNSIINKIPSDISETGNTDISSIKINKNITTNNVSLLERKTNSDLINAQYKNWKVSKENEKLRKEANQ